MKYKNRKQERIHYGNIYARHGRIHARPRLHLKCAVGYRRDFISRIELELLRQAVLGH